MSSYHQTTPQSNMIRSSYQSDEGSDQATNNNNYYNRPQHLQQAQPQYQHMPHGAMTSILSAADYSPINYKESSSRNGGVSKEKGTKIVQTNNNKKEDSNTKKALRMRASKYFHRSPTPPINNKSSNNKNMARQNNSPQSDATTALATTSTTTTTTTQQQVHISPTVTPDNNNTSSKQSIFSNTNTNSVQRPPNENIPRPEPQTTIQTVQKEAKLTSANIQQLQQQSITINSNNYNSDINSDPSLELYPSASNSNANGYANGGYDSDIQSNATSGYNSGSDLENAARRIMRGKGKRKLPKVPVQLNLVDDGGLNGEEGGKGISDGNLSDIGNVSDVDIDSKRDSRKGKKKGLPTGWRERIQRKTGIELPQMNTTSPSRKRLNAAVAASIRVEKEKSAADYALSTILNQHQQGGVRECIRGESYSYDKEEGNDQVIQPLPNYRNMSSTTIDYSDDYARGQSQYNNSYINGIYQNDIQQQQQQHNVPYGQYNHNQQYQHNVQFVQGQQQYRQHDQEYYIEDLVNNGAFPNYDYGRGQPQQSRQGYVHQQQPGSYGYPPPPQAGYSHHPQHQYHQHHQQQQNSSEVPLPTTYEYQNGNHVSYNYNRERGGDDQQYYSNQDESWNPDNVIQKEQLSTIHDVSQEENDDSGIINTSMQAVNAADNSTDYSQYQKSQQQQHGFVPITINSLGFPPTPNEDTFDDPGFDLLPSAFNNDSPPLEKQTTYTEVKRVRFSSSVEGNEDDVPDDEKEEDTSLLSSKSQSSQQQHDISSAGWEEIPSSAWYDSNNNVNSTNYFATRDADFNEVKNSTPDKSTADFDIFAWNEEDDYGGVSSMPQWKLRKMTAENKVSSARQSSPSRSNYQRSRGEGDGGATSPKLSPTKPVYVFDNERQSSTPPSTQQKRNIYPHSDGDISGYDTSDVEGGGQNNNTPGRRRSKSSRRGGGLSFFKSRRRYASEGERSDSEWESSADEGYVHNSKPSFSMSPLRGRRKKKSSKGYGRSSMSPLGKKLFGHRQHHSLERTEVNEGKYTWDGGEQTLPPLSAHSTGRSVITTGHIIEAQRNVASPSTVMNSPIRTKTEHVNAVTYQRIEAEKSILNTSKDSSGNTNLNSSGNNLNISGVTQETERHSNMKPLNDKSHPWKKGDSPQKVEQQGGSKIEQSVSKESILSGEQSGPTITTESRENDEDTISTLGSLVTKGSKSKSKKVTSSDMSTVTELSEIEKLRQENARLREELENASQISSNVVSMYAQTLKNENHRLKEELKHTSAGTYSPKRNGMFKSTLETLLEEDNKKRIKKQNRRRRLKSMTAARQEAVTDFNLLPPAAHLINGVDFDDDSITAYSQPERRGGGCETAVLLLKSSGAKIATTTRTVASQVKIVAQDMNNERKLNGMDGAACVDATSRPLDCFRTCARNKDGSMDNTYRIARKKKKKPKNTDGSSTTGSLTIDDSLENGGSLIDSQKTKSPARRRRQATAQT